MAPAPAARMPHTAWPQFLRALSGAGSIGAHKKVEHWGELFPLATLIHVIEVEHIHHGAEMSLLRDLHRGTARSAGWSP